MSNVDYLKEIEVSKKIIPTRVFFAPINTGYSKKGVPDSRLIKFHKLRSGNKIGISYIGNVAIDKEYVTNSNTVYFNKENKELKELADIIKKNGSIPGIQIGCRFSNIIPDMNNNKSDKYKYIKDASIEISNMKDMEIDRIINLYVYRSIQAYKLGFEVVQIHAAHGYFLSLMLSNSFNERNDNYGVDKLFIIKEIVRRIKEIEHNILIDLRISLLEGVHSIEKELEYKEGLFKELVKEPIDIISITNGIYNVNKEMIYPEKYKGNNIYLEYGIYFAKKYPEKIWNIAGNIDNFNEISKIGLDNLTFSIGRLLISDPLAVLKASENKSNSIKKCTGCGKCHYYSKGERYLKVCSE